MGHWLSAAHKPKSVSSASEDFVKNLVFLDSLAITLKGTADLRAHLYVNGYKFGCYSGVSI
jgi:hypothetical protein